MTNKSSAGQIWSRTKPFYAILALSVLAPVAQANDNCVLPTLFDSPAITAMPIPVADLAAQAAANYKSPNISAYKAVEQLRTSYPTIFNEGNQRVMSLVKEVLENEELSMTHQVIERSFNAMSTEISRTNPETAGTGSVELKEGQQFTVTTNDLFIGAFQKALVLELQKTMPVQKAIARARILEGENLTRDQIMKALGDLTRQESLEALIGPNGIHQIAPDSLVGRFMSEAAAKFGKNITTHIGRFYMKPEDIAVSGPERLYVSVDATTMQLANEIFNQNQNLLIHNHTPRQGTLYLQHNGYNINYASLSGAQGLASSTDSILPLIPLSTYSGSRTYNYAELGSQSRALAKYPSGFRIQNPDGTWTKYSRDCSYNSCTHWVGEMPIGDRLTDTYTFPGHRNDDPYATPINDPLSTDQSELRHGPVGRFTHYTSTTQSFEIGNESRRDRLARLTWREGQGYEQLWKMIDQQQTLADGEFANPGYVLYSFIGRTQTNYVPVVLVVRNDASAPFTQQTLEALKAAIYPK